MKLYREVQCTDRQPDKNGKYRVTMNDGDVLDYEPFRLDKGWWSETFLPSTHKVESWLEPIEITNEEIKRAASEYEKIACCEKDHPWLKEYVNEDFEAGAKWYKNELSKIK